MTIPDQAAEFDWAVFEAEFKALLSSVDRYRIMHRQEILDHKASAVIRDKFVALPGELRCGHARYADDPDVAEMLTIIAAEFGFGKELPVPPFLSRPLAACVIRRAIVSQQCSVELMDAWARLNVLFGWYSAYLHFEPMIEGQLARGIAAGVTQAGRLQLHWYARWITQHCERFEPKFRYKIDEEIASVCLEVANGSATCGPNFKAAWFSKMLTIDSDGNLQAELKSTYRRLSTKKIKVLSETTIDNRLLPPVTRNSFRKIF